MQFDDYPIGPISSIRCFLPFKSNSPVMRDMPSIQLVKTWYVKSFQELRSAPIPNTVAKEADFAV